MKIYAVVDTPIYPYIGDEFEAYIGTDLEKALKIKKDEIYDFERFKTAKEKKKRKIEGRVYEIPDTTDITDKMELSDAICDAGDYDLF